MRKPASAKQLTFELFYHEHKPFFSRAQAFFVVSANLYRREQKRGWADLRQQKGGCGLAKRGRRAGLLLFAANGKRAGGHRPKSLKTLGAVTSVTVLQAAKS